MSSDELSERAYEKAIPILRRAFQVAGGVLDNVDFEAVRRCWLARLTPAERAAVLADDARSQISISQTSADVTRFLRRLGLRKNVSSDTVH
jgi:hypothetical protein